ncbi:MAG: hypothetical protein WBM61_01590 [Woeseiaceae bacterium]
MPEYRWTRFGVIWFRGVGVSHAQTSEALDPLFQSTDILEIRIAAPFHTILTERSNEEDVAGKFQYTNEAGDIEEVNVGIRTRGISRRNKDICPFPPLRLDFKSSQVKKSLLHKQDKLKLVTHCKDKSSRYKETPLREYLAYRMLNELTDVSFRVRLMRITYADTDGRDADRNRFGFVIEHKDRLAKRLGIEPLKLESTRVKALRPDYTNLISMFHYMIGNTDFSPIAGPDAECCHNHVLLGAEGELLYSVPYDFDQAGLVDAPYGHTQPKFRLRNAKQRLYRGRCRNGEHLASTMAHFSSKRETIFRLISEQEGLSDSTRGELTRFIEKFYAVINSPKQVERQFVKKCI